MCRRNSFHQRIWRLGECHRGLPYNNITFTNFHLKVKTNVKSLRIFLFTVWNHVKSTVDEVWQ